MKHWLLILLMPWIAACDKIMKPIMMGQIGGGTTLGNLVILVWGQSNNLRWQQYGEAAFLQDYHKRFPSATVSFINCSVGGTTLGEWQIGGQLTNQCDTHGLKPNLILFYQGEADAYYGSTGWAQQFTATVAGWRTVYNVPVVFAQIAVEDPTIYCPQSQWDSLQAQQASVSIRNVTMIKTADISQLDPDPNVAQGVHLSQESYVNIAHRYVQAILGQND